MKTAAWITIIASSLPVVAYADLPDSEVSNELGAACGNRVNPENAKDYRLRESADYKWFVDDVNSNHLFPAISRMDSGDFSRYVFVDLDYMLERWPNHYAALQALMRYEVGGGRTDHDKPVVCYFQAARQFAPDDANVLVLKGAYLFRKKDLAGAEASWHSALQIDPKSADAHYNLGLLYVQTEKYDDARRHATAAYDAGYPLPGLRRKLVNAGQWQQDADEQLRSETR